MVISGLISCVSSIVREDSGFRKLCSLSQPVANRKSAHLLLVSRQNRRLSSLARLYLIIPLAMTSQDPLPDEHKKPRQPPYKRSAALVLTLEFQGLSLLNRAGLMPRRRADSSTVQFSVYSGLPLFPVKENDARAGYLGSTREPLASL